MVIRKKINLINYKDMVVILKIFILFTRREPIPNPGGSVRAADGQAGEGIILSGLLLSIVPNPDPYVFGLMDP